MVCERLSLWITNGEKKDCFWRSAMSGGRATLGSRKGVDLRRQAGDICAVAPEGHVLTDHWYIECKHVKDMGLASFLLKGTGALAGFWKKACEEATKHRKQPLIIARQNSMPIIMVSRVKRVSSSNCLFVLWADYAGKPLEVRLFESTLATPYHASPESRVSAVSTGSG